MSSKGNFTFIHLAKVLFAVVVWGASFIATKIALQDVSPVTVVWLRFAIGVLVIGIAVFVRGQFLWPSWKDIAYFAILGFIGITYHQWLQSTGLVTAQASTTAWIVSTTPIFIAILGWIVLKEKMNLRQVFGIVLASVGVILVVSEGEWGDLNLVNLSNSGNQLIMLSAPNWAIFSVLSRRGLMEHPAMRMMFFVMSFGWLFTAIPFIAGSGFSEIEQLSANGWISILFLGIACSGLAYIFWYDGLQALQVSKVGAMLYIEPVVAVIIAAIILGETIHVTSLIGGLGIFVGVYSVERFGKLVHVVD
ncbi:MAG: DMT family transporter [Chloroflexi bacterium]|nr:DMT family transporter [Chloroflexota bacterium]